MARSTGTLDACYGGETILLFDSLHLVGRGGEGEWLLQLVAHVQTQFQVLNKKRLHCLTLEYQIARHRQTFCMCCRGWWVGKPPSMIAFPLPRIVGQAKPVSSSTCNNGNSKRDATSGKVSSLHLHDIFLLESSSICQSHSFRKTRQSNSHDCLNVNRIISVL